MKLLNKNNLKNILIIVILVIIFVIYNQQNKSESPTTVEINTEDYMKVQELLDKNEIDIDVESYLHCKKSHIVYNDEYGNDETECDIYTFDINRLVKSILQESKN